MKVFNLFQENYENNRNTYIQYLVEKSTNQISYLNKNPWKYFISLVDLILYEWSIAKLRYRTQYWNYYFEKLKTQLKKKEKWERTVLMLFTLDNEITDTHYNMSKIYFCLGKNKKVWNKDTFLFTLKERFCLSEYIKIFVQFHFMAEWIYIT